MDGTYRFASVASGSFSVENWVPVIRRVADYFGLGIHEAVSRIAASMSNSRLSVKLFIGLLLASFAIWLAGGLLLYTDEAAQTVQALDGDPRSTQDSLEGSAAETKSINDHQQAA